MSVGRASDSSMSGSTSFIMVSTSFCGCGSDFWWRCRILSICDRWLRIFGAEFRSDLTQEALRLKDGRVGGQGLSPR
jgi:hypothetical protein